LDWQFDDIAGHGLIYWDMAQTLVQSSAITRSWLQILRDELPQLEYSEAKYYANFKTGSAGRAVTYLNPQKRIVRVFLALQSTVGDPDLKPTPSTSHWAARFPSVFRISSEQNLIEAKRLILKSQEMDASSAIQKKGISRARDLIAEELPPNAEYVEGAVHQVLVNAYERNRRARAACLRHFGRSCAVCGLSFKDRYGDVATGYIQVHHIVPIAQAGAQYRLNPTKDLRPVCPNCHAVIHRGEPPFSIQDVKQMLRTSQSDPAPKRLH
jgi:hypothetical protein